MMILTVVMFGISATYFALDVFLVSDGILHPDKYPHVIDRHGREAAAQIICQAINVRPTLIRSLWHIDSKAISLVYSR